MNIGRYMADLKSDGPCLLISSQRASLVECPADCRIAYKAEDEGPVDILVAGQPVDREYFLLEDSKDLASELKAKSLILIREKLPSHYYIDSYSIPIVLSHAEYGWLD